MWYGLRPFYGIIRMEVIEREESEGTCKVLYTVALFSLFAISR